MSTWPSLLNHPFATCPWIMMKGEGVSIFLCSYVRLKALRPSVQHAYYRLGAATVLLAGEIVNRVADDVGDIDMPSGAQATTTRHHE